MSKPVTREAFGALLDHAGLPLTEAQKSVLFEVYPLLQKMIERAQPEQPREAEMSVMFSPEVL